MVKDLRPGHFFKVSLNFSRIFIQNYRIPGVLIFLPPADEVCEGYVFTPVCQSFCSQGAWVAGGVCVAGVDVHGRG